MGDPVSSTNKPGLNIINPQSVVIQYSPTTPNTHFTNIGKASKPAHDKPNPPSGKRKRDEPALCDRDLLLLEIHKRFVRVLLELSSSPLSLLEDIISWNSAMLTKLKHDQCSLKKEAVSEDDEEERGSETSSLQTLGLLKKQKLGDSSGD